jgi:hypothetical protein
MAEYACCAPMFWLYLLICCGLVAFAGIMSGLTLGLMSLSIVDLEVLRKAGKPEDQKNAGSDSMLILSLLFVFFFQLLLLFLVSLLLLFN